MDDPLTLAAWLREIGGQLHSIESRLYDTAARLERPALVADWQYSAGEDKSMNIDELEAGPELDALIAEQVMGLNVLGTALVNHDPECCSCLVIRYDGNPGYGAFERPVYLADCVCEFREEFAGDADYFGHHGMCLKVVPAYYTDIAAAWEVVAKMLEDGYHFRLRWFGLEWQCCFSRDPFVPSVWANTVPLAISLAAEMALKRTAQTEVAA